jgi:hypothetical protein
LTRCCSSIEARIGLGTGTLSELRNNRGVDAQSPQAYLEGMVLGTQDRLMQPYGVATLGLD